MKPLFLVLLAGQSNMAGRGAVEPEDLVELPGIWKLTSDLRWVPAVEPVHFDRPFVGTGPGRTFARLLKYDRPELEIGLVPCAVGGSNIGSWKPGVQFVTGEFVYDNMLKRMAAARKDGTLGAILWHQGENDADTCNAGYAADLEDLVFRMRRDLDAPDVPFIAGELGDYFEEKYRFYPEINRAIHEATARMPRAGYVSSAGLRERGDRLHFNADSARELGRRYYTAFRALTGKAQ